MEPDEGWTVEKQPNIILRIRAWAAWRAYQKAERPYRRLSWEMDALEAEREAVLQAMLADHSAGRLEEADIDVHAAELLRINVRFAELAEPWRKADAAMRRAYAATQGVLRDLGFREVPDTTEVR